MKSYHDLLQLSAELPNRPYCIDNFISEEEHRILCDLYDSLPVFEPSSHKRATRKDYLMFSEYVDTTQKIFYSKLQNLWPEYEVVVDGGNFTDWHSPVAPHSDNYQLQYTDLQQIEKKQEIASYAVLVPLRTDTGHGQPYTLFFDQYYYGHSIVCGVDPTPDNVVAFTDAPFDKNSKYYPLIDYVPDKSLHGLSIQSVLPWTNRSALIWHRAQIHCASKFHGYNSKLHLIFLLTFKTR